MNNLPCILVLLTLGCTNHARENNVTTNTDSTNKVSVKKTDYSKYHTIKDSIKIGNDGDSITYSKEEFNQLIDEHPELINDQPSDPDLLYYTVGDSQQFGSELGKDEYYILYAYFLRQKNAEEKYIELRNTMTGIYSNINSLFAYFKHGGTYFGHQNSRIQGYVEYAVYRHSQYPAGYEKTYDISKQKQLYINSLRQLVTDEISIDLETPKQEKPERTKELNKIVGNIDKLITNNFYLRNAQAFQYDHYQYE